jgi:pimeloyl-ACP methyl ester carboxylesterase
MRIVLVHGAFGGAWSWEPVIPGLVEAGHTVEAFDLPGSGDDQTPVSEVTLDAYARRVCEVLAEGPPALLVGHSMGGVVVTQAAATTPEQVETLAYVAAFAPTEGQSLIELTSPPEGAGDQVQANIVVDGDPPVATMPAAAARVVIYGCSSDEAAAKSVARRRPCRSRSPCRYPTTSARRSPRYRAPTSSASRTSRSHPRCRSGCRRRLAATR